MSIRDRPLVRHENAVRNSVPGVEAECGSACACATCHVYISEEWTERVGPPEAMERYSTSPTDVVRPRGSPHGPRMEAALDGDRARAGAPGLILPRKSRPKKPPLADVTSEAKVGALPTIRGRIDRFATPGEPETKSRPMI